MIDNGFVHIVFATLKPYNRTNEMRTRGLFVANKRHISLRTINPYVGQMLPFDNVYVFDLLAVFHITFVSQVNKEDFVCVCVCDLEHTSLQMSLTATTLHKIWMTKE